jgi:hypothetical protein
MSSYTSAKNSPLNNENLINLPKEVKGRENRNPKWAKVRFLGLKTEIMRDFLMPNAAKTTPKRPEKTTDRASMTPNDAQ